LEDLGALPERPPGLGLAQADFTGDGMVDAAVTLIDRESEWNPPLGSLHLISCLQGAYQIVATSGPVSDAGAPTIEAAEDLNGDGVADLLVSRWTCGAHTCFAKLDVWVWEDSGLESRFIGASDDLPYPEVHVETDPGQAGRLILVRGTNLGSVGAGPYRPRTRIWRWDAQQGFVVAAEELDPPLFRAHLLHDADRASRQGDLGTAAVLYSQAIDDDTLQDWDGVPHARASLSAYATFRLGLLEWALGDSEAAISTWEDLPSGTPSPAGEAYARLADALRESLGQGQDWPAACAALVPQIEADPSALLDSLYSGYANPVYTAEDLCAGGGEG
jgi:hypothetical protein